jgi:hypothetical protein
MPRIEIETYGGRVGAKLTSLPGKDFYPMQYKLFTSSEKSSKYLERLSVEDTENLHERARLSLSIFFY